MSIRTVIDKIGNLEDAAIIPFNEVEARFRVLTFPTAQSPMISLTSVVLPRLVLSRELTFGM